MSRDSIISEAFDNINNIEKCRNKKLAEGKRNNPIPKPFDKYFEIDLSDSEDDFQPGEEIPGYDCHFLAFLVPKEKYEDKKSGAGGDGGVEKAVSRGAEPRRGAGRPFQCGKIFPCE